METQLKKALKEKGELIIERRNQLAVQNPTWNELKLRSTAISQLTNENKIKQHGNI